MKKRRKRRTLPAGRHIAAAEIRHHVDACELSEQRRVAKLNRVASAVKLLRAMTHRLAMRTDGANVLWP